MMWVEQRRSSQSKSSPSTGMKLENTAGFMRSLKQALPPPGKNKLEKGLVGWALRKPDDPISLAIESRLNEKSGNGGGGGAQKDSFDRSSERG